MFSEGLMLFSGRAVGFRCVSAVDKARGIVLYWSGERRGIREYCRIPGSCRICIFCGIRECRGSGEGWDFILSFIKTH